MPKEKSTPALRDQALACLARREHSRAELMRKLEHAGHPEEEISTLLDEFEARNWLSDPRFAESYVADHRDRSGAVKLAYELRQRGIAVSVIEEVLEQERDSELERARKIWLKKYGAQPVDGMASTIASTSMPPVWRRGGSGLRDAGTSRLRRPG